MILLSNECIAARINPMGAELTSLQTVEDNREYLWKGDPAIWGKHSPVLFPFVGSLRDNSYYYRGKKYESARHGFAREKEFAVLDTRSDGATFRLQDDINTRLHYPFPFLLELRYQLKGFSLEVTYFIKNPENEAMYFSVGGHPAFAIPLEPGLLYENYLLRFAENETAGRWPIAQGGLIENESLPLLNNSQELPLSKDLFAKDAIVLKHLHSKSLQLLSPSGTHGVQFDFPGFPFLGIWAAKGADFVCIEPWCGIADSIDSNQILEQKEGIERLEAGQVFERKWTVTLF